MPDPRHDEFLALTHQRYYSMRRRLGRPPFDLTRFREFVIELLGGEQGVTRCEYCNAPVSLQCLQLDHRLPPASQGGSLGFENLAPCCEPCNQQKGQMSGLAFMALLNLVNHPPFSEVDRTDILGRLQSQLKLAINEQIRRRKAAGTSRIRVVRHQRSA